MPFSQVNFTYNGGAQVFPTNFALGVLETEHIVVNVNGQVDGLGNPIAFAFTYDAGTGEVTVLDALTVGWSGTISRITPVDNVLVDFEANADVTKRNLSRATKQVLMVVQELTDAREADSTAIQNTLEIVEDLQADIDDDVQAALDAAALATTKASEAAASAAEAAAKEASMITGTGPWVTATVYTVGDLAYFDGSQYECIVAHTSGVFATDLGAARWRIFAAKGASGTGSGNMNNEDNLNFLTNKPLALATIGGQPADTDLAAIAALASTGLIARTAAGAMATRQITSTDGSVTITNPAGVAGNIDLSSSPNTWERVATVYDSAVNGVQTSLVTPDFEDGYSYRLVGLYLSGSGNAGMGAEFFRQTSAAYSSVTTIGGATTLATNFTYTINRPMEAEFYHNVCGEVGVGFATTPANSQTVIAVSPLAITHAVAQKISRIRITRPGQNFTSGKLYLERQKVA